jgi:hypothetical protein
VVRALQALRGMALVAAATVIAELGDITRFDNPRQLMAYLGLVPFEHSSGVPHDAKAASRKPEKIKLEDLSLACGPLGVIPSQFRTPYGASKVVLQFGGGLSRLFSSFVPDTVI